MKPAAPSWALRRDTRTVSHPFMNYVRGPFKLAITSNLPRTPNKHCNVNKSVIWLPQGDKMTKLIGQR